MIYLGSDHAGYLVKCAIVDYFNKNKIPYVDCGTNSIDSTDYQKFAFKVCEKVILNKDDKGILVCGTGVGMSIAANKVPGIIAGLVDKKELTVYAVSHDHCNVLCLSGKYVSIADNLEIVQTFLNTTPLYDYHYDRVKAIIDYENNHKK
ncbi:RpiB/LacA/LacB family sugar-phosphate isomerase [bacterium]|nr:RpiB/LacA/LacB family sugar-phosphate isomerase [bacterium]